MRPEPSFDAEGKKKRKVAVFFPLTFSPQPFFIAAAPALWLEGIIIRLLLFLLLKLLCPLETEALSDEK
jgi:hypothetical protein